VDQPVGYVSILNQPGQHWQLMTAGQRHVGAFEATTADPVEDEACAGGLEAIRRQHRISSLQSAPIGHDHPQKRVGRSRKLPLQRACAMPEIENDRVVRLPGCTNPIEPIQWLLSDLTQLGKPQIAVDLHDICGAVAVRFGRPQVEERGQASAFLVRIDKQGRDLPLGQQSSERHREE